MKHAEFRRFEFHTRVIYAKMGCFVGMGAYGDPYITVQISSGIRRGGAPHRTVMYICISHSNMQTTAKISTSAENGRKGAAAALYLGQNVLRRSPYTPPPPLFLLIFSFRLYHLHSSWAARDDGMGEGSEDVNT